MDRWSSPAPPTSTTDAGRSRNRRWAAWCWHLLALCAGLAGIGCAVALPFAPVWAERTEVHWSGESTTALFAPYRPAEFTASVPCPALRGTPDRPTTVLSTVSEGSARDGLVLTTRDGEPHLVLGQREVPLPAGTCGLRIESGAHGTAVRTGIAPPILLPEVPAPEVFAFRTDLDPAAGVSVTARPYSWFDTAPTRGKSDLAVTAVVLAAASLLLLVAHGPRAPAAAPRWRSGLRLPVDLAVAGVLALWLLIGPNTEDDGFAMMTVRNYEADGYIGNYYRWFNAAEAPFTLVQHLMRAVAEEGPAVLRAPSAVAGLLTWLLLSRGIVAPLCRGSRAAVPLASVFFLACWLPFGLGIRPEPAVALGLTATVAALFKADRSAAPAGWLGLAAASAGLTVAVTPTGIAALVAVAAFAPRVLRLLARPGAVLLPLAVSARLAALGCLGCLGLVAMFADSTWTGVRRATHLHEAFGPSLGWYQELNRYASLLSTGTWGSASKRLAVFLVLVAVLLAAACALRRLHYYTGIPGLPPLLGSVVGVFAVLVVVPSKWTHHFGALAGVGPALLAVVVVLLARVGALERARREARLLGVVGGLAAAGAAALAFRGPNAWPFPGELGLPWADTPVRPLDSPPLWLAVGALAGLGTWAAVRRRAGPGWTAMPGAVLGSAALAGVLVLLGSFLTARDDRVSTADCGLAEAVEVLPLRAALHPVPGSAAEPDGFTPTDVPLEPAPPTASAAVEAVRATPHAWASTAPGTGSLSTPWFALPPVPDGHVVALRVAGRPGDGTALRVEFAAGDRTLGTRELRDPPPAALPYDDPRRGRPAPGRAEWRVFTLDAPPPGADRLRLRAEDRSTAADGWLAVGGPVLREVVPLHRVLAGAGPTLVDWPLSFHFPCHRAYPRVGGGTAASPRALITPAAGEDSMAYDPTMGGVFAGVPALAERYELPSRLRGAPGAVWGHLLLASYGDLARDAYATRVHRERIGGAAGDPPYPFGG
ncbi:arabinosyltransferase domain-containing protein [Saccharopolyspora cebuensis]|uniref:Arabinosyltransferase domain-containing protein n=1 Tax=Saccharopolyspora cebuensis TaxID=418759 RepID=A0ABV4CEN1_9PSEU